MTQTQARSILCLPILVRSRLLGVLYLENSLIVGAFSRERLALLEVVSAQLAISLDNARLYGERQERAELAAREQATMATALHERSRLAAFLEQAPAAILVLEGPEHTVTLVNPPYLRLVGKRAMKGLPLREALPEASDQGYMAILDRVYASGEPFQGRESRFCVTRGREGIVEDLAIDFVYEPFRSAGGEVQGIMVFGFEVTDLVRARDEREALIARENAARQEAEAANRSKDEFLAMLGHELRNPLAPIVTALHLLNLRDGDRNQKERSIIERQVTHLVRLVDDLLDVSRITSGKIELKREATELAEVVAKAIELASPLLERRRHELVVTVPRHGLVVDCDAARLAQVVSNLLANAAKYTEAGGRVTIVAERLGETIELRVRDNGIGIAQEMLSKVFDAFTQETQALARSQGGLGLGLAIVRSLVAMHGGTVSARSGGLGQGAEFLVRLPASVAVVKSSIATPVPSSETAVRLDQGFSVLVVDDNEDAAEMICDALTAWGYTVRVAHDGPGALRLVPHFTPRVALLDIGLPVMDGYELARLLQRAPGLQKTRLVALTGYGQASDRQHTTEAGFDAHLVKPIDMDELQAMLERWSREDPAT